MTFAAVLIRVANFFASRGTARIGRGLSDDGIGGRLSIELKNGVVEIGAEGRFIKPQWTWTKGKAKRPIRTPATTWACRHKYLSTGKGGTALFYCFYSVPIQSSRASTCWRECEGTYNANLSTRLMKTALRRLNGPLVIGEGAKQASPSHSGFADLLWFFKHFVRNIIANGDIVCHSVKDDYHRAVAERGSCAFSRSRRTHWATKNQIPNSRKTTQLGRRRTK